MLHAGDYDEVLQRIPAVKVTNCNVFNMRTVTKCRFYRSLHFHMALVQLVKKDTITGLIEVRETCQW